MNNNNNKDITNVRKQVNESGVVVCTYEGKPVEIITLVDEKNYREVEQEQEDDLIVYGCSNTNCHSFGIESAPCDRCGEDSSCYYLGQKLTMKQVKDAIDLMEKEEAGEENDTNEDESK